MLRYGHVYALLGLSYLINYVIAASTGVPSRKGYWISIRRRGSYETIGIPPGNETTNYWLCRSYVSSFSLDDKQPTLQIVPESELRGYMAAKDARLALGSCRWYPLPYNDGSMALEGGDGSFSVGFPVISGTAKSWTPLKNAESDNWYIGRLPTRVGGGLARNIVRTIHDNDVHQLKADNPTARDRGMRTKFVGLNPTDWASSNLNEVAGTDPLGRRMLKLVAENALDQPALVCTYEWQSSPFVEHSMTIHFRGNPSTGRLSQIPAETNCVEVDLYMMPYPQTDMEERFLLPSAFVNNAILPAEPALPLLHPQQAQPRMEVEPEEVEQRLNHEEADRAEIELNEEEIEVRSGGRKRKGKKAPEGKKDKKAPQEKKEKKAPEEKKELTGKRQDRELQNDQGEFEVPPTKKIERENQKGQISGVQSPDRPPSSLQSFGLGAADQQRSSAEAVRERKKVKVTQKKKVPGELQEQKKDANPAVRQAGRQVQALDIVTISDDPNSPQYLVSGIENGRAMIIPYPVKLNSQGRSEDERAVDPAGLVVVGAYLGSAEEPAGTMEIESSKPGDNEHQNDRSQSGSRDNQSGPTGGNGPGGPGGGPGGNGPGKLKNLAPTSKTPCQDKMQRLYNVQKRTQNANFWDDPVYVSVFMLACGFADEKIPVHVQTIFYNNGRKKPEELLAENEIRRLMEYLVALQDIPDEINPELIRRSDFWSSFMLLWQAVATRFGEVESLWTQMKGKENFYTSHHYMMLVTLKRAIEAFAKGDSIGWSMGPDIIRRAVTLKTAAYPWPLPKGVGVKDIIKNSFAENLRQSHDWAKLDQGDPYPTTFNLFTASYVQPGYLTKTCEQRFRMIYAGLRRGHVSLEDDPLFSPLLAKLCLDNIPFPERTNESWAAGSRDMNLEPGDAILKFTTGPLRELLDNLPDNNASPNGEMERNWVEQWDQLARDYGSALWFWYKFTSEQYMDWTMERVSVKLVDGLNKMMSVRCFPGVLGDDACQRLGSLMRAHAALADPNLAWEFDPKTGAWNILRKPSIAAETHRVKGSECLSRFLSFYSHVTGKKSLTNDMMDLFVSFLKNTCFPGTDWKGPDQLEVLYNDPDVAGRRTVKELLGEAISPLIPLLQRIPLPSQISPHISAGSYAGIEDQGMRQLAMAVGYIMRRVWQMAWFGIAMGVEKPGTQEITGAMVRAEVPQLLPNTLSVDDLRKFNALARWGSTAMLKYNFDVYGAGAWSTETGEREKLTLQRTIFDPLDLPAAPSLWMCDAELKKKEKLEMGAGEVEEALRTYPIEALRTGSRARYDPSIPNPDECADRYLRLYQSLGGGDIADAMDVYILLLKVVCKIRDQNISQQLAERIRLLELGPANGRVSYLFAQALAPFKEALRSTIAGQSKQYPHELGSINNIIRRLSQISWLRYYSDPGHMFPAIESGGLTEVIEGGGVSMIETWGWERELGARDAKEILEAIITLVAMDVTTEGIWALSNTKHAGSWTKLKSTHGFAGLARATNNQYIEEIRSLPPSIIEAAQHVPSMVLAPGSDGDPQSDLFDPWRDWKAEALQKDNYCENILGIYKLFTKSDDIAADGQNWVIAWFYETCIMGEDRVGYWSVEIENAFREIFPESTATPLEDLLRGYLLDILHKYRQLSGPINRDSEADAARLDHLINLYVWRTIQFYWLHQLAIRMAVNNPRAITAANIKLSLNNFLEVPDMLIGTLFSDDDIDRHTIESIDRKQFKPTWRTAPDNILSELKRGAFLTRKEQNLITEDLSILHALRYDNMWSIYSGPEEATPQPRRPKRQHRGVLDQGGNGFMINEETETLEHGTTMEERDPTQEYQRQADSPYGDMLQHDEAQEECALRLAHALMIHFPQLRKEEIFPDWVNTVLFPDIQSPHPNGFNRKQRERQTFSAILLRDICTPQLPEELLRAFEEHQLDRQPTALQQLDNKIAAILDRIVGDEGDGPLLDMIAKLYKMRVTSDWIELRLTRNLREMPPDGHDLNPVARSWKELIALMDRVNELGKLYIIPHVAERLADSGFDLTVAG